MAEKKEPESTEKETEEEEFLPTGTSVDEQGLAIQEAADEAEAEAKAAEDDE